MGEGSEPVTTNTMDAFVTSITSAVTDEISLTAVATTVGIIITAGIGAIFAWKFARKGYNFVKNALSGKNGKF